MNHLKYYEFIINRAKFENRKKFCGIYYENHHILPRCLGGLTVKENLVLLTAKEHFVCHKLLTYIYPKNRNIALAYHRMAFSKSCYEASPRDYAYARELLVTTEMNVITKEKIGLRTKGKTYKELYGDDADIQRKKRSIALKNKKHSAERIENNRKAQLGKIPWNKGLTAVDKRVKAYIDKTRRKPKNI